MHRIMYFHGEGMQNQNRTRALFISVHLEHTRTHAHQRRWRAHIIDECVNDIRGVKLEIRQATTHTHTSSEWLTAGSFVSASAHAKPSASSCSVECTTHTRLCHRPCLTCTHTHTHTCRCTHTHTLCLQLKTPQSTETQSTICDLIAMYLTRLPGSLLLRPTISPTPDRIDIFIIYPRHASSYNTSIHTV